MLIFIVLLKIGDVDIIFITGTPKGQIPVLEVDGKMICESLAIVRFIAREYSKFSNWTIICDFNR